MSTDDFIEIAELCINRYKEKHNTNYDRYIGTLYVAISSDDKVFCSNTTHILSHASKLILIHKREALAVSNWYNWYKLEFIDKNGSVTEGYLGDGLKLNIDYSGSWANQAMTLWYEDDYNSRYVKDWYSPFENKMQEIWDICCKFRDIKSKDEAELLLEVIHDEETRLELKAELDSVNKALDELNLKYRDLLNKIK